MIIAMPTLATIEIDKMPKLSKRLRKIASFIPKGAFLSDVGSDHGYLPIALIEEGTINYSQAIENKKGPYTRLVENIERWELSERIFPSFSSGLDELDPRANCLSICGMGGLLIVQILKEHKEKLDIIQSIVVDPHRDEPVVREYLSSIGYKIEEESIILDKGIFYSVMRWVKTNDEVRYNADELALGPINIIDKSDDFLPFLKRKEELLQEIAKAEVHEEKRKEIQSKIEMIRRYL